MKQKSSEVFIAGPAGRLEAKYFKNEKKGSPIAIVLQPHPQYGGTMNNKIVQESFNVFVKKYNVHNIIRILSPDFKLIKKNMNRFTHFNIQNTINITIYSLGESNNPFCNI